MILCPMAVCALHVEFAAHMNIIIFTREVETLVEVAMLDAIPAATVEVAFAAVLTSRGADRTSRGEQVNALGGITKQTFAVCAGIRMTGEAIHVFSVR